ncbi:MAG: thioredoxin domain-containing protein, partial [Spirochaetales bacterium]|nr:thioredoxin domain-containing protein [Spirochaetales bacterium]
MADPQSDSILPRRNNLADASSPYLRQHRDNPVWWQEWSADLIERSRAADKPLFVSVGYATCHWCHVMAAEAFSDRGVADALNRHFVSIKIDREERPDIDHFMMQFLLATRGHGGWPLNVFLTPELKPMLALTYAPVAPRGGMPGFEDILGKVATFYG